MKGFKTLNVKKDTYEMITDLGTSGMSQDDVIKMLIRNSAELRDAKQEIERLKKENKKSWSDGWEAGNKDGRGSEA